MGRALGAPLSRLFLAAWDDGDFARQLLRKLYGKSELAECILPPNHPRFTRPPVENERSQIFHGKKLSLQRVSFLHSVSSTIRGDGGQISSV